jgi:predicted TIM-barrel fold metal-dependent hydrolase
MVIDFHTHVFPPWITKKRQKYIDSDPTFAILYSKKEAKLATADELVQNMDREGIEVSVITNIGWTTHDLCVETNDYIMESIARYPTRLIGFCAVQPNSCQAAVDEIERCTKGGIKGVGELRPDIQLFDVQEEEVMVPLVEAMMKYNMILLIHASEPVGHLYAGKGVVTPEFIYPLITGFPDLTIVCSHWGGGLPFYALMPEVKQVMRNVYFDTAASPFLYVPQIYEEVIRLIGEDKILFGSDYPLLLPSRLLEEIKSLSLPEGIKSQILAENAYRATG